MVGNKSVISIDTNDKNSLIACENALISTEIDSNYQNKDNTDEKKPILNEKFMNMNRIGSF